MSCFIVGHVPFEIRFTTYIVQMRVLDMILFDMTLKSFMAVEQRKQKAIKYFSLFLPRLGPREGRVSCRSK